MPANPAEVVTGYRAGDQRRNSLIAYESERCGSCDHLVWVDSTIGREGRQVRCTVCLAAAGVKQTA